MASIGEEVNPIKGYSLHKEYPCQTKYEKYQHMKVILIMVQSLNGKITKDNDPDIYKWTSKEDQEFFFRMLSKHTLTIMGSRTYEAARENIKPYGKRRRIILTSTPDRYRDATIPGQIEFSSELPGELITRLGDEGYETALLVGGAETNRQFFEAGLVDELYITIEPRLFGKGKQIIADGNYDGELALESVERLNEKGTLLLKYKIREV